MFRSVKDRQGFIKIQIFSRANRIIESSTINFLKVIIFPLSDDLDILFFMIIIPDKMQQSMDHHPVKLQNEINTVFLCIFPDPFNADKNIAFHNFRVVRVIKGDDVVSISRCPKKEDDPIDNDEEE